MNKTLLVSLKKARLDSGLRQRDVADKLGIKDNTLSNWENGRTEPDIDTLIKLCNIYKINCADLLEKSYKIKKSEFTQTEKKILEDYRSINTKGQEKVEEYIVDIVKSGRYNREDNNVEFSNEISQNVNPVFDKMLEDVKRDGHRYSNLSEENKKEQLS